ncbi:MAG: MASE3 domain-containing protein [Burkholderiales bacterium]
MQAIAGGKRRLRREMVLVALLSALALLAMMLPISGVHIPPKHYLAIHTLLEFASIVAAFLVFATVWHTPAKEVSASLLLIAIGLFAAGWLDFAHAMSLEGMPDLITSSSVEKGIAFWLAARLVVALTLLGVSLYPRLRQPSAWERYGLFTAYAIVSLMVMWGIIFHEADLPDTYFQNSGVTSFKEMFEWVIAGLLVFSAYRFYRLARLSDDEILPLIFGATAVAALAEFFLVHYEAFNDVQNLLGHLYKLLSYSLIYRAVFVVSVRKPYQKLARQAQTLLTVNATLRTQSLALESMATPVVVTDLQGKVRWRNRAARTVVPPHASQYEDNLSLFSAPITPDPMVAWDIRATVEAGKVWRGLIYHALEQGDNFIFDRTVTPLRNEAGVIEGYISVAENVTKNIRAQLRHKRVIDTAIDGFWIADMEGHLLEVNDAYARMSGYTAEELLTMNIAKLEAAESPEEVRGHMQKIMDEGQHQFESRHRHKQGYEFAVEVSATYDSKSQQLFVFTRDRSEHEQSVAAKQDLERQLQQSQKMQALGHLTSGIAHDFNNILAAILGYSNLALDRFAPEKQGKLATYLREVITASERARDLIARMLTFTRTQPSAAVSVIFPAAVVQEAIAMVVPSLPSSIQIRSRIEDNLQIRMDASELSQILVNLIINARDAITSERGIIDIHLHHVEINGRICAFSRKRLFGSYLALDVSDNGSGIAPEHMPLLFDPFFTTKEVGKGTGLGLSMVQGILLRSNSHVVVESRPGRGSRFQLLFPIASPPEALLEAQQSDPKAKFGLGQHIWVVDDEPAVARYFGELLEDWGYRVRLYNDPLQVLTAFETEKNEVDLLISDQSMPGLSGMALASRLLRLKPDLPIILCSGHSDGIDHSEVSFNGIRRYFSKPVPGNDLLNAVAEELGQ